MEEKAFSINEILAMGQDEMDDRVFSLQSENNEKTPEHEKRDGLVSKIKERLKNCECHRDLSN